MPQAQSEFDADLGDLWTLCFKRKRCPRCHERLQRRTIKHSSGPAKWHREGGWTGFTIWYGERVKVTFACDCASCRLSYSLSQLRYGLSGEPIPPSETAP